MGSVQGTKVSAAAWPEGWFEGSEEPTPAQLQALESVSDRDATTFVIEARACRAELLPDLWSFAKFRNHSVKQAARSAAIAKLVYKLVPKTCDESEFWRSYWCHAYEALAATGLKATPALTQDVLARQDDVTSTAIVNAFDDHQPFLDMAKAETVAILKRDAEDDEKLAAGIKLAADKGAVSPNPIVEPVTEIDVLGKTADQVAGLIIRGLGDKAQEGCVVVLQGLSGTGKGTTVDRVKKALPNAVTWSNGNVFRSLTLLAIKRCESLGQTPDESGKLDLSAALTGQELASFVKMLDFGWHKEKWDIRISGLGVEEYVSEIANTRLKEAAIGKHIPMVAEQTQGEVISFASGAAAKMGAGGKVVLMEGRAPTLAHVRTPFRFELTMSDTAIIGKRRAAQRMMASALKALSEVPELSCTEPVIAAALVKAIQTDSQ